MKTRKHIIFSGHVQGVGFRWRAKKAAELYGCTGWVRNDWNGTVSMEIQGEEEQIDQTLEAIQKGRFIRIDHIHTQTIPTDPEERSFQEKWD